LTEEATAWRVSSYTGGQGNCVEVGKTHDAVVVRDTKNREAETLRVSPAVWREFIRANRH
jgi:hypothetical protein